MVNLLIKFCLGAFVLASVASCNRYATHFNCQPSEGIPCTPVHEIEKLLVETQEGPDILLPQRSNTGVTISKDRCGHLILEKRVVWVAPRINENGELIGGCYVPLPETTR
ncbi:MAG: hypothetical protein ACSNEK_00040 [Parachlamydiaceae bacterium]